MDDRWKLLWYRSKEKRKIRPNLSKNKVFFHHDNAGCTREQFQLRKLSSLKFELFSNQPYLPDSARCEFFYFITSRSDMTRKKITSKDITTYTNTYSGGSFWDNLKKLKRYREIGLYRDGTVLCWIIQMNKRKCFSIVL